MKTSKTLSLSWQNKLISTALAAVSLFLGSPQLATANVPSVAASNATVVAGSVTFGATGSTTLTVTQTSPTAVVSWGAFSDGSTSGGLLGTGDTVTFDFHSTGGAILNNITGTTPTILDGAIRATNSGNVFFLNPNGIVVSSTAQINVGGFYASTIPDSSAISYFYANGTLGVFNNVAQTYAAAGTSGVIYIESGASIQSNNPSAGVNLASGYSTAGSGVTVSTTAAGGVTTGYLTGSGATGNVSLLAANGVLTLNQGIASGAYIKGVTVDSASITGSLNIISLGSGAGVNLATTTGNTVVVQSGYTSAGALTGGNLSITANNGPVAIGVASTAGNLSINTIGSTGSAAGNVSLGADTILGSLTITANGSVTTTTGLAPSSITIDTTAAKLLGTVALSDTKTGVISVTTNNANISNTGTAGLTSTGSTSVFNAGSQGNITLNGTINGATSVTGNQISITDAQTSLATFGTVSAVGNVGLAPASVNITNAGGLTLTNVTANGGLTATSYSGSVIVGSSSSSAALNTINGNVIMSGNTGASLYTTNIYYQAASGGSSTSAGSLWISTNNKYETVSNYSGAAVGNVTVQNVTLNGNLTANAASTGSITLSGVAESSTSGQWVTINGYTNAGTITLSGVTTSNGNITMNSAVNWLPAKSAPGSAYAMTLTNVTNNTANYLTVPTASLGGDIYQSANGSITMSGLNTLNTDVTLSANKGSILSGSTMSSIGGPNLLTENNGGNLVGSTGQQGYALLAISTLNKVDLSSSGGVNFTTPNATTMTLPQVALVASTVNGNVSINSGTDLKVTIDISSQLLAAANTLATTAITLCSTGNITTTNVNGGGTAVANNTDFIVPQLTVVASKNVTFGSPVDSTSYASSLISITTANTISTSNVNNGGTPAYKIGNIQAPQTLTLTSTSGNINFDSTQTSVLTGTAQVVNATATTGNISISAALTGNAITLTAGTGISESDAGSLTILNNKTLSLASPIVNLGNPYPNSIPNLITTLGATSVTVNSGGIATLNVLNGTNVPGNLTITTNSQAIVLGLNAADAITVAGTATFNTSNTNGSVGAISTVANNLTVFGNVTLTTNNNNASLGSLASASNFGQISSSVGTGTATINEAGIVNLGTTSAATLVVNSQGIVNSSGVVSATTANLSSGTLVAPGSIAIGQAANPALITSVNVLNTGVLSYNSSTSATTINASNQNISTLVLNGAGALNYTQTGGSVGTVTAIDNGGILSYTMVNAPTTSGSLTSTGTSGGMVVSARGTGSLGALTYNLGTSGVASSISNNGSWTASNIISSVGSNATLLVTENTGVTGTTATTLTLGSGINLQGTGAVTFSSGNASSSTGSYGTVTDGASAITINSTASPVVFNAATVTISNLANSLPAVSITTNGYYSYTNNGNIQLGVINLGTSASGTSTVQSITGNIYQNASVITDSSSKAPLQFLASTTTPNSTVTLGNANNFFNGSGSSVSITASGNSVIYNTGNTTVGTALYLGAINVVPSTGAQSTNSQLSIKLSDGTDVKQTTSGSIYVWGNTTVASGTTGNISLTNGGNNFGALTLSTGSGNISLTETATSAYNKVTTSGNFTAVSSTGDIVTATGNSAFSLTGNSSFAANTISLTNVGNQLNGTGGSVTFNSSLNTTLVTNQSTLVLGNGSFVAGNLSVTNALTSGFIQDQAGTSGITVLGTTSLIETGLNGLNLPNGSIYLTGSNNNLAGGIATQSGLANVQNKGNLVLLPSSKDTTAYYTSITGNITTAGTGGSNYGTLTLSAPFGNITISNPTGITTQLYLSAPNGTANVSYLSLSTDLQGVAPSRTNVQTYVPPSP